MEEARETWIQTLSWEDPLEEEIAAHFSILPERISWTEEAWRATAQWGYKELDTTEYACSIY